MDYTFDLDFGSGAVGVDEAGCGPWAGPVVAAAARLTPDLLPPSLFYTLQDSKKIPKKKREALFEALQAYHHHGIDYTVGIASVDEIDQLNIAQATQLAMHRAIRPLSPTVLLIDGIRNPGYPCLTHMIIKGDAKSPSIAAASIIAKVVRDRYMTHLHAQYPYYEWDKNAGYGTAGHQNALKHYGLTPHHRRSFKPIHRLSTAHLQPCLPLQDISAD